MEETIESIIHLLSKVSKQLVNFRKLIVDLVKRTDLQQELIEQLQEQTKALHARLEELENDRPINNL